ncbi:MAG: hypothetical protein M0C28_46885 [Candidatus Moduliflexus flocculans]|nr:hypothetical protein [Candidatus Moduliflexus flocculans]
MMATAKKAVKTTQEDGSEENHRQVATKGKCATKKPAAKKPAAKKAGC